MTKLERAQLLFIDSTPLSLFYLSFELADVAILQHDSIMACKTGSTPVEP